MSRVDAQQPLLPSVLDRLLDDEPDVSQEPNWRQSQSLAELKNSVRRDLEALLNTRQARPDLATGPHELAQSVLSYGLPDSSSLSPESADDRERFRRAVERAITVFEPRLRQIQVTLREPESRFDKTLHLVVDALLWVEPYPQPIAFDTVIKPATGGCEVHARG